MVGTVEVEEPFELEVPMDARMWAFRLQYKFDTPFKAVGNPKTHRER